MWCFINLTTVKFRFIAFLIISSLSSFAQEGFTKSKYLGVELGGSFTNFRTNELSVSGKNGFMIGISNEHILRSFFSVKFSFVFERKGAVISSTISNSNLFYIPPTRLNLNYLVIPVLFSVNSPLGFYFNAGPYVGFLPLSDVNYKQFDFGAVFGAGIRFMKAKKNIFEISIKENLGLMNIRANDYTPRRNNTISLSLAYRFRRS